MNVGFIGTGTMGQPMVANLLKKGFAVLAWDVVPAALGGGRQAGRHRSRLVGRRGQARAI